MTAAETIASFATSITLDDVPDEVVEHAKRRCRSSAVTARQP
jgi:hypothetical protein